MDLFTRSLLKTGFWLGAILDSIERFCFDQPSFWWLLGGVEARSIYVLVVTAGEAKKWGWWVWTPKEMIWEAYIIGQFTIPPSKFNSSPLKSHPPKKAKDRLPIIIFQGLCYFSGLHTLDNQPFWFERFLGFPSFLKLSCPYHPGAHVMNSMGQPHPPLLQGSCFSNPNGLSFYHTEHPTWIFGTWTRQNHETQSFGWLFQVFLFQIPIFFHQHFLSGIFFFQLISVPEVSRLNPPSILPFWFLMVWVMAELPGVTWGAGRSTGSSFWIFQDFGSANVQRATGAARWM